MSGSSKTKREKNKIEEIVPKKKKRKTTPVFFKTGKGEWIKAKYSPLRDEKTDFLKFEKRRQPPNINRKREGEAAPLVLLPDFKCGVQFFSEKEGGKKPHKKKKGEEQVLSGVFRGSGGKNRVTPRMCSAGRGEKKP